MSRETINPNVLEGLESINSIGRDDEFEGELPKNDEKIINEAPQPENKEEIKIEKEEEKEVVQEQIKDNQKEEPKKVEKKIVEQPKKEEPKKDEENLDEEEDEEEDEKIIVKKINIFKKKLLYSLKDDTKFMILPREKMPSNIYFYFIIFLIFTSISIISDIFSMIISIYKGQIFFVIIAIFFRLIFITSNIITFKFEIEAIIIIQLIINNCLFFYSVLFFIFLIIYHSTNISNGFILFCYIFYGISIGCNFMDILYLYLKYYKIYVSMTEDDIKYLKIFNKRNISLSEIQLVEKN